MNRSSGESPTQAPVIESNPINRVCSVCESTVHLIFGSLPLSHPQCRAYMHLRKASKVFALQKMAKSWIAFTAIFTDASRWWSALIESYTARHCEQRVRLDVHLRCNSRDLQRICLPRRRSARSLENSKVHRGLWSSISNLNLGGKFWKNVH